MGIQKYHTWLSEKFPGAYIPIKGNNIYEYIYLDVNYLLHNAIYDTENEEEFIEKLFLSFDIIFSNFIATKKIFFSLDGPSSYAKILLQRKRRSDHVQEIVEGTFSSICLTPGTNTMTKVEEYIKQYSKKLQLKYKYIKPEIEIASANTPDEGEIKICNKVIENGTHNINDKHLIIGNDSDLIVLSMAMKPVYNINLLVKRNNKNELLSIAKLLILHCKHINKKGNINKLSTSNLRNDFVIISIMMGNDYLPKIGNISYGKLWEVYYNFIKYQHKTITNDNNFNIDVFEQFIYAVYKKIPNKIVSINTYNYDRVKNYTDGLLWCLQMYKTGKCPKYDYAYDYNDMIHPFELLFYIVSEKDKINTVFQETEPIPAEIYSLIVMPKKAKFLIPKKYHKLINNELSYLYKKEECDDCLIYKKTVSQLYHLKEANKDDDSIKEKYHETINKHKIHKLTHPKFSINDVNHIINTAKKI